MSEKEAACEINPPRPHHPAQRQPVPSASPSNTSTMCPSPHFPCLMGLMPRPHLPHRGEGVSHGEPLTTSAPLLYQLPAVMWRCPAAMLTPHHSQTSPVSYVLLLPRSCPRQKIIFFRRLIIKAQNAAAMAATHFTVYLQRPDIIM